MRDYAYNCLTCGKACTKRIKPSQESNPPKYCCNKCKFETSSRLRQVRFEQDVACHQCGKQFRRTVGPKEKQNKLFCSVGCAGLYARLKNGCEKAEHITQPCEHCGKEFSYKWRQSREKKRFCSRTCAQQVVAPGYTKEQRLAKWIAELGEEAGREKYAEFEKKLYAAVAGPNNAMYGKHHTEKTRDQISNNLKEAHETGRIKLNFAGYRGEYKGIKFRSLLEYSFLCELEKEGLDITTDVVPEPVDLRVPWFDIDGTSHTYYPDFLVKSKKTVYEVKPECWVNASSVQLKAAAATRFCEERNLIFQIITPPGLTYEMLPSRDDLKVYR